MENEEKKKGEQKDEGNEDDLKVEGVKLSSTSGKIMSLHARLLKQIQRQKMITVSKA